MLGKVIDSYQIQAVLGKGGMGVVYKAIDTSLDKTVALKVMNPYLSEDERFLGRFKSEAKALGRLHHPNIVGVFALRHVDQHLFIVMEFVEGLNLADRIKRSGPMVWQDALPIMKQTLSAIDYAHQEDIIHRDIKPHNILLSPKGVAKMTDFGLAKIQVDHSDSVMATRTGFTGGTLYYMPPEQLEGLLHVDHRGDIYGLGMTFYEMLAGRTPFDKLSSEFAILKAIDAHDFPSLDQFNKDLPAPLVRIISKAIERHPDDRYQSAGAMLKDLEDWEAGGASAKKPFATTTPTRKAVKLPSSKKKEDQRSVMQSLRGALTRERPDQEEAPEADIETVLSETPPMASAPPPVSTPPAPEEPVAGEESPPEPISEEVPPPEPVSEEVPPPEPVSEEPPLPEPVSEGPTSEEPAAGEPSPEPISEEEPPAEPVSEEPPEPVAEGPPKKITASRSVPLMPVEENLAKLGAPLMPGEAPLTPSEPPASDPTPEPEPATADEPTPAPESDVRPDRPARRRPLFIVGGVAALAVLAFLIYLGTQGFSSSATEQGESLAADTTDTTAAMGTLASFSLRTNPDEAEVFVDSLRLGSTPLINYEISAGTTAFHIEKEGYLPFDTLVVLDTTGTPDFSFALREDTPDPEEEEEPEVHTLTIQSEPPGAEVLLDGQSVGQTPLTMQDPEPGDRALVIRKRGFLDYSGSITVEEGQNATVNETLTALTATLQITVRPFGDIYVDEMLKAQRTGDPFSEEVGAGIYRVRVMHPQYGVWERQVMINESGTQALLFNFEQEFEVRVTSEPDRAEILVDGRPAGKRTPGIVRVRAGRRTISVRRRGYVLEDAARILTVEGNRTDEPLHFTLRAVQ